MALASLAGAAELPPLIARLSEEAEVFARLAPETVSQETLRQRTAVAQRRFRPRIGKSALEREYHYRSREVVSEYGFTRLQEPAQGIFELRQVVSIDGRSVTSLPEARRTLTLGLQSNQDHHKKRMIEEFARTGLVDPAVDFGQIILLFTRRGLANYRFAPQPGAFIGAERAAVCDFIQESGQGAYNVFEGRQLIHLPIRGRIWSRAIDLLPLRIELRADRGEGLDRRYQAAVDYQPTAHGVVLPVSVVQTTWEGDLLITENRFTYAPFQRFSASAEIKFTELPPAVTKP
jgi:hypothetical protein